MPRNLPNRHARKSIAALMEIEAEKKRQEEFRKQEELRYWSSIDTWWIWASNVISRYSLDIFNDILEDKRSLWVFGNITKQIYEKIDRSLDRKIRYQLIDEAVNQERKEYLKIQRELDKIEPPARVPDTDHYQWAASALNIMFIHEKKNHVLQLMQRFQRSLP